MDIAQRMDDIGMSIRRRWAENKHAGDLRTCLEMSRMNADPANLVLSPEQLGEVTYEVPEESAFITRRCERQFSRPCEQPSLLLPCFGSHLRGVPYF